MGELHLEIIKDRILNHYKVKADMGKVCISYRGTIDSTDVTETLETQVSLSSPPSLSINISISPFSFE